jgi:hypothetical protein
MFKSVSVPLLALQILFIGLHKSYAHYINLNFLHSFQFLFSLIYNSYNTKISHKTKSTISKCSIVMGRWIIIVLYCWVQLLAFSWGYFCTYIHERYWSIVSFCDFFWFRY